MQQPEQAAPHVVDQGAGEVDAQAGSQRPGGREVPGAGLQFRKPRLDDVLPDEVIVMDEVNGKGKRGEEGNEMCIRDRFRAARASETMLSSMYLENRVTAWSMVCLLYTSAPVRGVIAYVINAAPVMFVQR